MPGTVLSALHKISCFNLQITLQISRRSYYSILQLRKLRPKKGKRLCPRHGEGPSISHPGTTSLCPLSRLSLQVLGLSCSSLSHVLHCSRFCSFCAWLLSVDWPLPGQALSTPRIPLLIFQEGLWVTPSQRREGAQTLESPNMISNSIG